MRAIIPKDNITNPDSLLNKICFVYPAVILVLNKAVLPIKQIHHNVEPRKTPTIKNGISELLCDRWIPEALKTPRKKIIVMGLDNVSSSDTAYEFSELFGE
nr:hypothetical protein [Bacillus sp. FJAT-27264]